MESISDGNNALLVFRFRNFFLVFFIKIPKSEFLFDWMGIIWYSKLTNR